MADSVIEMADWIESAPTRWLPAAGYVKSFTFTLDEADQVASALRLAAQSPEPVAWVMPGDDNARDNGFIDAMAWREGEFTKPLYTAPPAPAGEIERLRGALKKIKSLLSYANQNIVTPAARQSNINSAWWQADAALNGGRAE